MREFYTRYVSFTTLEYKKHVQLPTALVKKWNVASMVGVTPGAQEKKMKNGGISMGSLLCHMLLSTISETEK